LYAYVAHIRRVFDCVCTGEWRKALSLLLRMINAGLEPDLTAYNAAISASAKCGTLLSVTLPFRLQAQCVLFARVDLCIYTCCL
jgi:pentatricopeptide repeat protein